MLCFIKDIRKRFLREHGFLPNVLYLNRIQYRRLQADLSAVEYLSSHRAQVMNGLDIILSPDCVHPHVAWSATAVHEFAAG